MFWFSIFFCLFVFLFATRHQRVIWTSSSKWFYMGTHCSLKETHKQAKIHPGLLWSSTGNLKAIRNSTFYLSWARTSLKSLNFCSFLGVWNLYIFHLNKFSVATGSVSWFSNSKFQKDKSNCPNSYFYKDFQSHRKGRSLPFHPTLH